MDGVYCTRLLRELNDFINCTGLIANYIAGYQAFPVIYFSLHADLMFPY